MIAHPSSFGSKMRRTEVVFRNVYIATFAVVVEAAGLVAFTLGARTQRGGVPAYAVIFAVCLYLVWSTGWCSAVRVNDTHVLVDNVFTRHRIPLSDLSGIDIDSEVQVTMADGTQVVPMVFRTSLIVALLAPRYVTQIGEKVRREIASRPSADTSAVASYETAVVIPWIPLLVIPALIGLAACLAPLLS
jgi:hypothetical protein